MKRVGSDRTDELLEVPFGTDSRELTRDELAPRRQVLGPLMVEGRGVLERLAVSSPKRQVSCLLGDQPLVVPGALQQGIATEQRADARMVDAEPIAIAVGHD